MKVLLLTLVLLLSSVQVLSLTCYTCEGDVNCKAETVCPASSQYCKTMEHGEELRRTCEDLCGDDDDFTNCCSEDLCGP
ncbi:hypothetical protein JOQ06_016870 [Pogonophryne albipinna]|uniref:Snake toxin/toxin-like domain-containing protein n=1 Tax=Pogonophryne albipinna TaxID=1090488 RepID=A0AAD6B169_9TELE|nr:hypothetical protein JOQ06_016870 [Pogonophryne albipinna]